MTFRDVCPTDHRGPAICYFCGKRDSNAIFMQCRICKIIFPEATCSRCFIATKEDILIKNHLNDSEMHQSVELI